MPIFVVIILQNSRTIEKDIQNYCQYLYFNWIAYPDSAEKMKELPEEVNKKLFEWFRYDKRGQPIKENYLLLKFQYDKNFLISKQYIGIPFLEENKLVYKKLMIENDKIISIEESVW